ncbi:hypothetical protein QUF64_04625 [Anaerolineales bacterium HSG6]|nr:hypothetical protein [Anaerolineales bacterium HSG6]MDM8532371.1 hypothetical protein [Anaerolineales bacterium HSG25]
MTEHKDIQNPDEYDEEDYKRFQRELFSPLTSQQQLEEICMTLAHLPTKEAQDLLTAFQESDRASEVSWLEMAVDEGEFHYMSPMNKQESRDYLALKMVQEMWDTVIELEVERDELQLAVSKRAIKLEAIQQLIAQGELDDDILEIVLNDLQRIDMAKIEELSEQITTDEKIYEQIQKSIKTERYRDVDPFSMRNTHFTGSPF